MANALFSRYSDYILSDATWSGTAPQSTYELATFAYLRPDWRVKYGATTVTITATIGTPRKADVFALPMHNLDPGTSPTIARLTNNNGFAVDLDIPAVPADSLPLTAIRDLRNDASASTRTATVWNLVITGNSVNVTLGALIWLGLLNEFTANYRPGFRIGERRFNSTAANAFGTVNRVNYQARERYLEYSVPSRDAQRDALVDWARSGEGSGLPSLFWPDPSVNDALVGSWPDEYASTPLIRNFSPMDGIRFTEWSKGVPIR